jgi:CBS domain containing-hemolysin-like protein
VAFEDTTSFYNAAMDLLLIVFLTLLNGVFAMSELALASSRKARLAVMDLSLIHI